MQRFNVSCNGENDVKIGITSMITEMNITDGEGTSKTTRVENAKIVKQSQRLVIIIIPN